MNILFLTTSFPRFFGDGTAPFVNSIAKAMAENGNNIFILAPYDVDVDETYIPENIHLYRFKYFPINSWHIMGHSRALKSDISLNGKVYLVLPFFFLCQFFHSLRILINENIDIIYSHWVIPNGFTGSILKIITKKKLLISLHGSDIYLAKKNILYRFITKFIFRISDEVTACSEDLYQFASKNGANNKVHLLAWGADPDIFFPSKSAFKYFGNPILKSENEIFIISIGRLVFKKGFDVLIRACENILKKDDNIKLLIGGSGDLENELLQLVAKLNLDKKVIFVGKIHWNDVVEFLRIGDIFVLPSIIDKSGNIDGLPTVLLEAMSTGLPVIASDIGGVRLVINENENGLIFNSGDSFMLEKKLVFLLNNPDELKKLGFQARNSIISKFNWNMVANEILQIIAPSIK